MGECILREKVRRCGAEDAICVRSAAVSREELGNGIYPPAAAKLREKGVPLVPHRAALFTAEDYARADYVLYMDADNLRRLNRIASDTDRKYHSAMEYAGGGEVADPWYTGDFERTYRDLDAACTGFLRQLGFFERGDVSCKR